MRWPDFLAKSTMRVEFASTGAPPGSDMPSASQTICMEFAVPMPEQTPGLVNGVLAHAEQVVERQILPATWWPAPRNTSSMSTW